MRAGGECLSGGSIGGRPLAGLLESRSDHLAPCCRAAVMVEGVATMLVRVAWGATVFVCGGSKCESKINCKGLADEYAQHLFPEISL